MTDKIVILVGVAVIATGAFQLGRIAERWERWGEAFERLRAFKFTDGSTR